MDKSTLIYLGIANFVGVTGSLLFFSDDKEITKTRLVREIFGSIWISSISYFGFKHFLIWSDFFIYSVCSLISFLNSQIISFVGKDLMEAIGKSIVNWIKTFGGRKKNSEEEEDINYQNNNDETIR